MLEINLDQYSGRRKLYDSKLLKLLDGEVNVLIGPNGTGKTYAMHQIKDKIETEVFSLDLASENDNDISSFSMDKNIARWIEASEGQRIYDNIEFFAINIGKYVKQQKEKNEPVIILLDGIDSGMSIDLINQIRNFMKLILDDCKNDDIECYIVISANTFELTMNYRAIWIKDMRVFHFNEDDYKVFRQLYLKDKN